MYYVPFFSPRIVLHMLIVLSVRESFLLLRISLPKRSDKQEQASGESVTIHGMCVILISRDIHFFTVVPTQAAFDFSAGRRTTRHGVLPVANCGV